MARRQQWRPSSKSRKPCIFCDNTRTNKKGEHVWDDWLNREAGRDIRLNATVTELGEDGRLIRERDTISLDITKPVVCDTCNNEWMNDLTSFTKTKLEGSIRRSEPVDLDERDIVTLTAWAFLKTAVLDWAEESLRRPRISRVLCTSFRRSLASDDFEGPVAIPRGFQLWIAHYQGEGAFEAKTHVDEIRAFNSAYNGYAFLVVTYIVGHFLFQSTFPTWIGLVGSRRPPLPAFERINDQHSERIWPFVNAAHWPPPGRVTNSTFESFRERLRRVMIQRP